MLLNKSKVLRLLSKIQMKKNKYCLNLNILRFFFKGMNNSI